MLQRHNNNQNNIRLIRAFGPWIGLWFINANITNTLSEAHNYDFHLWQKDGKKTCSFLCKGSQNIRLCPSVLLSFCGRKHIGHKLYCNEIPHPFHSHFCYLFRLFFLPLWLPLCVLAFDFVSFDYFFCPVVALVSYFCCIGLPNKWKLVDLQKCETMLANKRERERECVSKSLSFLDAIPLICFA